VRWSINETLSAEECDTHEPSLVEMYQTTSGYCPTCGTRLNADGTTSAMVPVAVAADVEGTRLYQALKFLDNGPVSVGDDGDFDMEDMFDLQSLGLAHPGARGSFSRSDQGNAIMSALQQSGHAAALLADMELSDIINWLDRQALRNDTRMGDGYRRLYEECKSLSERGALSATNSLPHVVRERDEARRAVAKLEWELVMRLDDSPVEGWTEYAYTSTGGTVPQADAGKAGGDDAPV
jgi:hypothetical protein